MKYKIKIISLEPYPITSRQYEATDGKVYDSKYSIPEGAKAKEVEHPTGATGYNERELYEQETDGLDLKEVIKAVNQMK